MPNPPRHAGDKPPTLPPITTEDAAPARLLQVEINTRISTQPLHYRAGDEEDAVQSVRQLFRLVRGLLANHPKALAFEAAALFVLNRVVRPNTTRWHRWLVDGQFQDEITRRQVRYELQNLRPQMVEFVTLLGWFLAGETKNGEAKATFEKLVHASPAFDRPAQLGGPVLAGIGTEINFKVTELHPDLAAAQISKAFATAADLNRAETRFIRRRRRALGIESNGTSANAPLENATGLCLSGGGIRSATFCLGIVQVLAREGLLKQMDYLSTVSGGGYLGSFLSAFLGTPSTGLSPTPPAPDAPFETKAITDAHAEAFNASGGRESAAVRHLRNNSRYLLNGGVWGRVKIFGLLISGILTNLLLILPLPLCAVLAVVGLNHLGYWGQGFWWTEGHWIIPSPALTGWKFLTVTLAAAWLLLPVARSVARGRAPRSWPIRVRAFWETGLLALALLVLLAAGLVAVPAVFRLVTFVRGHRDLFGQWIGQLIHPDALTAAISGLTPFVFGLLAARLKEGRAKTVTTFFFSLSGPIFYGLIFLVVGSRLLDAPEFGRSVTTFGGINAVNAVTCAACLGHASPSAVFTHIAVVAVVTCALTLWGWLLVDINEFSPHRYYRNRLCECYLAARKVDQTGIVRGFFKRVLHGQRPEETVAETGVGKLAQLPLSRLNETGAAPYHLLNTAVNLPASHEPNLRGRNCDFFVLSRDYCGGPVCGYVRTATLEALDPHVDLGTAMAISGAAASTNMGVKTMRQFRFLLALLNIRLGYWLRNPTAGLRRFWNAPGPQYLLREMTSWMHEKCAYLNLSDGGHIENLALYELLRRRCKFIVVVDGGMEPGMECSDLMLAQRYAEIDLGVRFNLDIADLALNDRHRSRAYAVFGKIHYSARPAAADGTLPAGGAGTGDLGWLVYLKLACVGDEPGYVSDYRRQNPDFPHQTTADQFYDEAQFEAYRRLGECAAESLFRPEITNEYFAEIAAQIVPAREGPRFSRIENWFQALATSLLPDNDEAFTSARSKSTEAASAYQAGERSKVPWLEHAVAPNPEAPVQTSDLGQGG